MRKLSLLLLLIGLYFSTDARNLSFVRYQVEQGLSHNTVWCVMQDSYDFMWFGTSDGLNCFDGRNFKIFRSNNRDVFSLGNNFIQSIFEDADHNIWVGTNRGVYSLNRKTEAFSAFNLKTEDGVSISSTVSKIIRTSNGKIWFSTLGQGIFIYDPVNKTLTQNSSRSSYVANLIQTPDKKVYITSRLEGLICFDENGKYLKTCTPPDVSRLGNPETNALFYYRGNLWFNVGSSGIYTLNTKTGTIRQANLQGSENISNIRKFLEFAPDIIWIGCDNGLFELNLNTLKVSGIDSPNPAKTLSDQSVNDLFKDKEGGLWVTTYFGGINYLSKDLKPFEHYFPSYLSGSISGKVISQFCEDPTGNLWIATEDGGLNYFDTQTHQSRKIQSKRSYHNIHSLMLDGNLLWTGTLLNGINVLNIKSGAQKNYLHQRDNSKSLCDNSVYAIYKSSAGKIYVGTAWGLCIYDPKTDAFDMVDALGTSVHIFNIMEDSRKMLWVTTYNAGIFRFDATTNRWSRYSHNPTDPESLPSNAVISVFEDKKGEMWFGTEGEGLIRYDRKSDKFSSFDSEDKMIPNPVIYAIQQDEKDNFWISTNAGLIRLNPYTGKNRLIFTRTDGLQSNQFNFRSSIKTSDGKMYFGGINGFNAFYPSQFPENHYIPQIRVVDFRLFNKKQNAYDETSPLKETIYLAKKIRLPYNQNTITLGFAALSYQAPEKNQYIYKLEGVDKDWVQVNGTENSVTYSNLTPGSYTFRLKGSNNDDVWNSNETVLKIIVSPPFWRSGWAYFFYLIVLASSGFIIYKRSIKRINDDNDARLRTFREKQEKESYLSKINFFTNISHELRTPLTLIKIPLERIIQSGEGSHQTKKFLETINKNTDYLLNLINELLDFRKTEEMETQLHYQPCNIKELIVDLHSRFQHPAEIKGLTVNLSLPVNSLVTNIDIDAFNKVLSNIMGNALKYASTYIDIELEIIDNQFVIGISDDGRGISDQDKSKIFTAFYQSEFADPGTGLGLPLAKNLIEKHQGTISIEDIPTGGSVFKIVMPIVETAIPLLKPTDVIQNQFNTSGTKSAVKSYRNADNSLPTLLIAEDNVELQNLISTYMSEFYQVYACLNGKEALHILEETDVDILVSDIMMPEMDGYELCESIKNNAQISHIPVILLTAKTNLESKIEGLESGADVYLEKPFSVEHLHAQINSLLNKRRLLREQFAGSPRLKPVEIAVSKKDVAFIEKLNDEIEKHLLDINFSIDTLADFMFMSRSNFYRKIKSISGLSPNDYLKTIRLKKAAEMLISGDYRISEVYENAGFSSSSYFAKCFRKQFGMLPKEFARENGSSAYYSDLED